jgi:hypothetical protein
LLPPDDARAAALALFAAHKLELARQKHRALKTSFAPFRDMFRTRQLIMQYWLLKASRPPK